VTSKRITPVVIDDLEATAELPVVDFAPAAAKVSDSAASTDIFPVPAIPAGAPELADGLREAEHQLTRERRRTQELEMQLTAAAERQATRDAQLADAGERQTALEAQLAEAGERQATLEAQLAETQARQAALDSQMQMRFAAGHHSLGVQHRAEDFAELRRRCERQQEALTCWEGFRATSEAQLDEAQARNAMLESQVARLSEQLRAMEGRPAPVTPRDLEKPALKSELTALRSELSALQAALGFARERQLLSEQRAEAEATRAHQFEAEMQTSVALLGVPPKPAERAGRDDAGKRAVIDAPDAAPLRVLVRLEGGSEVVYPIGRRTSIGRTIDNDIQIDATNISRHHAVLLAGADHCVVEDLNSTNGVHVNGQRVDRQVLRDGDVLRVGKVEFRFQQRS
jgi:hypothetical protein